LSVTFDGFFPVFFFMSVSSSFWRSPMGPWMNSKVWPKRQYGSCRHSLVYRHFSGPINSEHFISPFTIRSTGSLAAFSARADPCCAANPRFSYFFHFYDFPVFSFMFIFYFCFSFVFFLCFWLCTCFTCPIIVKFYIFKNHELFQNLEKNMVNIYRI
jgi:hypothetical protein